MLWEKQFKSSVMKGNEAKISNKNGRKNQNLQTQWKWKVLATKASTHALSKMICICCGEGKSYKDQQIRTGEKIRTYKHKGGGKG